MLTSQMQCCNNGYYLHWHDISAEEIQGQTKQVPPGYMAVAVQGGEKARKKK